MKRLLTYGCSNTYGESLPDCLPTGNEKDRMPPPSQFAWPKVLSQKLRRECVNLSRSGSSNKEIHLRIVETDFKEDDIVVVLWTHHNRSCFIADTTASNGKPIINKLLPGWIEKRSNIPKWRRIYNQGYYELYHTNENARYESQISIDHAYKHLEAKGIKNFHFTFDGKVISSKIFNTYSWFTAPVNNLNLIEDVGQDGYHPGLLAHVDIAEKMHARIENKI